MNSRLSLLRDGSAILDNLLPRQRESARLLSMGMSQKAVAETVGYHPAYMPLLKKNIAPALKVYNDARDESVTDIRKSVDKGAKDGLTYLLKLLDPKAIEHEQAPASLKVKVAQDMLDREGTAPKVSTQRGATANLHVHMTPSDIEKIKAARAGKLREVYAKSNSNTADAQLADLEANNLS